MAARRRTRAAGSSTRVRAQPPAMAISSTDCRSRVADGEPVWYLVPDGVVQYIGKHGLYRGDGGADGLTVTPA